METVPASRNSMERKGEPEIDLVGPVYSSRSGIIVRETVLPANGTSPEIRSADAENTPEKLVETGLGAPVSSMHAGGEWRVNRLATASPATTKDLFLQLGRAIDPLLAEPAWPAEVRAAQISDSNSVQSDISSVSRVRRPAATLRRPRCVACGASPRTHRRALHRPALPVPLSLHERTLLFRACPHPAALSVLGRLVRAARSVLVRRAALGAEEQLGAPRAVPDGGEAWRVAADSRRAAPAGMCTVSLHVWLGRVWLWGDWLWRG